MPAEDCKWVDLRIPASEFRAESSLETGQCFHWKRIASNEWLGLICGCCVQLRSAPDTTMVKYLAGDGGELDVPSICRYLNYGTGHPSLLDLQHAWGDDAAEAVRTLPGARVLRQDPAEALISFICSANNNVPRISLMLERMRQDGGRSMSSLPKDMADRISQEYRKGQKEVPSHIREFLSGRRLCSFPTPQDLVGLGETRLVELGLGYRARYVAATANELLSTDLEDLRDLTREDAERELRRFPGVGPKVAACVALYGLGFSDAVPVDVHVARVARRMAPPKLASRLATSLTPKLHTEVADFFRDRFGHHAGWAQHAIFAAQRHRHVAVKKSASIKSVNCHWDRACHRCPTRHHLPKRQQMGHVGMHVRTVNVIALGPRIVFACLKKASVANIQRWPALAFHVVSSCRLLFVSSLRVACSPREGSSTGRVLTGRVLDGAGHGLGKARHSIRRLVL